MKRTFLTLLTIITVVCIKQVYELVTANEQPEIHQSGSLSDIADEVIAIPLQAAGKHSIEKVNNVRKEGDNLFLISEGTLYRYNRNGEFVCRITDPEMIKVAGYVVNPVSKQVIVLGNVDDIHYYTYEGDLIEKKKLKSDFPEHRMSSVSLYKDHIWTTEECIKQDSCNQTAYLEKQVVEYDSSFRKINTHKLIQANLGRKDYGVSCLPPTLSVSEDTGMVYAYSPSIQPDKLLRDTLFLKEQKNHNAQDYNTSSIPVYPIRFGNRIWVSTYHNKYDRNSSYTFCYDTVNNESWQVQGGFKDNFYHTGVVSELQAMDIYNQSYCFSKSGQEIEKAFPEYAHGKSPILFIVKLKV